MFQRNDTVVFFVKDKKQRINRFKIGKVRVVDRSPALEEEVSYDVFVEAENCLYKHIPAE